MFTILLATAAALTGLASAQNYSTTSDGTLQIDPNTVSLDLRNSWCTGQKSNCYMICGGGADANLGDAYPNQCDPNDLTYTCTCVNGNTPNISDYMNTLPYYICTTWIADCTAAHPNDLSGQLDCQSVTCGTKNASMANAVGGGSASASGSASPSSTASSTAGSGGSGSSSASASASSAASTDNAAVAVGMNYGTGILMGGLLAVFGLAL